MNNQLKLFLNLKKRSVKVLVRKLDENEKKIIVIKQNQTIKLKYSLKSSLNAIGVNWSQTKFLDSIDLPSLTTKQKDFGEIKVSKSVQKTRLQWEIKQRVFWSILEWAKRFPFKIILHCWNLQWILLHCTGKGVVMVLEKKYRDKGFSTTRDQFPY